MAGMEGSERPRPVPAGWYPDPGGAGLRWWNGDGWTEHAAPAQSDAPAEPGRHPAATAAPAAVSGVAAVTGERGPSRGEWALSVLLPLLPLAGLIWGVYLTRRGDGSETAGNVAIVLSLVVILLAALVLL
jgi:hypothetical protein